MSKEALTWFGIPIIMGIGFLLFRIAMDLPTEQSTNMLVGLMTLAVLVFGSIAGYKIVYTFWESFTSSSLPPIEPKPESKLPTSPPAPVASQATATPNRPHDAVPCASAVNGQAPAFRTGTIPELTQPKKIAFLQGIFLGVLLGLGVGLMSPFSLQFALRSDERPDSTNTARKIPPVPTMGFTNPITGISESQDSRPYIRERIRRGEELGGLVEYHVQQNSDSFTMDQMLCADCQIVRGALYQIIAKKQR
jgi:hypothetical protein